MQSFLSSRTLASISPTSEVSSRVRTGAAIVAATALVAACAHVSVELPFTPVPVVLSDFAVVIAGLLLGPAAGFAAMLLYLAEGASGMPVFSPHGLGGVAQLLGPTGGFLLAYPVVAAVAGALFRFARRHLPIAAACVIAAVAAFLPLFLAGSTWLSLLLHLSPSTALRLAVLPFLPGAAVKAVAAAALIASLHQLRHTRA